MLADTAKLAIELNLTGNARQGIAGVERSLQGLSRQAGQIGQGFKTMGAGIGVAFRNLALLAVPVVGALAAGLIKSVKEGQEAAKVQTIYANAIANSGKVSTQYVDILNKQQTELMMLGGIDDELIKTEQTRLIQMGLTGEQVAKLTPLILDLSEATGKDLLTSTIAVGKSVNGSTAGLIKFGVVIDKAKAKTDPFGATLDALKGKFAGTTQALSGSLEVRLNALREGLANIREEAGMKLLPALTRIVDIAGRKLVPAFSKFVDRILPSVIAGLDKFASILENGGAERAIKGITDALGPMVELLKIAAKPVKLIVDAFLKLPSNVQGALIAGFAINKLSGGLIAQGGGQVLGGIGSLVGPSLGATLGPIFAKLGFSRGSTPVNPLFVSDVAGGIGKNVPIIGAAGGLLAPGMGTALLAALAPLAMFYLIPELVSKKGGNELDAGRRLGLDANANSTMVSVGLGNLLAKQAATTGAALNAGDLAARGLGNKGPMPVNVVGITQRSAREWAQGARALRATNETLILQRAIAAGFRPSAEAVKRTLEKNIAHLDAIKGAVDNVVTAVHGINVNASTGFVIPNGVSPRSPTPKPSGTPQIRNGFVVATAVISTRDVNTSQDLRSRAGPTPTQAGAW